jgi:flavorubredoxin
MSALPKTRITPTEIAPDTFVLHEHHGEGEAPVSVALNSMVIRAAEPVVVDTGVGEGRDQYFEDLFSIVEPEDVRWVFISHDDIDHTGNLNELMARCPNAIAIVNWFIAERMGDTLQVPPTRQRWVGDGESFDAGDRTLYAVRPHVYDSPTTRGLFDPATGVYWASDAFATPMIVPVHDVAELDPSFWVEGMAMFDHYVSPWLSIADDVKFQRTLDRVEALRPTAIAGCHTPAIRAAQVEQAMAAARRLLSASVPPQPDQVVLEQIQQALTAVAA